MASRGIRSFSILDLVGAFVNLVVAYCMLCVACYVYVASKFVNVFGFFLPCPCEGILGFRSNSLCLQRIFIEVPVRKIYNVRRLVDRNLVFCEYEGGNLSVELVGERNHILETSGEGCSSSFSCSVSQNSGQKEDGFDVKGEPFEGRKQTYGLRRRRKAAFGYRKFRSLCLGPQDFGSSSSHNPIANVVGAKTVESVSNAGMTEDNLLDSEKASTGDIVGEKTWDSCEMSGTFDGSKVVSGDSSSAENVGIDASHNLGTEDEAHRRMRVLEQALGEEKAARAALYLELEEERGAAATAADEAMAMIFRLQEEKASIEMEVRQSQRMIEEKVAYDEEEMNILKEILIRREREKFFLENELQAYRQALSSDDSWEDLPNNTSNILRRRPSPLIHPDEDLVLPKDSEDENVNYLCHKLPDDSKSSFQSKLVKQKKQSQGTSDWVTGESHRNSGACHLQSSEDEAEAVYDVHVVDDTTGHGKGSLKESNKGMEEIKQESHINCINETERNSLSAVSYERQKLDREVEWLREMLRIVQEGKEKLKLSGESRDRSKTQLNLLEDIQAQLQEIERMTGPPSRTSFPDSFSKVKLKLGNVVTEQPQ